MSPMPLRALVRAASRPVFRRQGPLLYRGCRTEVAWQALVPAEGDRSWDLDLPRRRRAPPLAVTGERLLYESSVDIRGVVAAACWRCRIGTGLALGGFAALATSLAGALPPAALVTLLGGAAANSYALSALAQRFVRKTAARHVERLTLLPVPPEAAAARGAPAQEDRSVDAASLLDLAATVEEQLAATPEIRLEVRTASQDRWLTLVDVPEVGSRAAEDDDGAGPHAHGISCRAPFGDICSRLRLLHVDLDAGTCTDQALVSAILSTRKVTLEERAEPREGSEETRRPGQMLSEVPLADVEQAAQVASPEAPAEAIDRIGRRAAAGGASVFMAGVLFMVGENARDPDGVARWKNLPL